MRSVGPKQGKPAWVAWYCRSCNRVVYDRSEHVASCMALAGYSQRTGKSPMESLKPLGQNECPDCYLGFKGGKNYCPTCGNTKEPPLDATGRRMMFGRPAIPAGALTDNLSTSNNDYVPGQMYRFTLKGDSWKVVDGERQRSTKRTVYDARCIGNHGPLTMFAPAKGLPMRVHRLDIDAIEPIDDVPNDFDWPLPVETCSECGHPEHDNQCNHTEKFTEKPFIRRCLCGAPNTLAVQLTKLITGR